MKDLSVLRSLLFTPADRKDRFAKALNAGADAVILDLEDGVPLQAKSIAQDAAFAQFANPTQDCLLGLRLNPISTEAGLLDLLALRTAENLPQILMLPKVESVTEIEILLAHIAHHGEVPAIAALIESAAGLDFATAIAAHPSVRALAFGGADLAADLGAELDWQPMLYARGRIVQAAAVGRIAAWDVPSLDIAQFDVLADEAIRAKAMGFTGKLAIHPAQLDVINRSFSPTAEQIDTARRIIAAFESGNGSVCVVGGKMIDAPVVASARRTVQLVERASGRQP
jgi:(S)-citramalyl-CoA lyase